MTPCGLHAPPRPQGALHTICDPPPAMSILSSLPATKKPIDRLSGDQKGYEAPSVPLTGWAVKVSSGRTQSIVLPDESLAAKTSRVPSGDMTGPPTSKLNT